MQDHIHCIICGEPYDIDPEVWGDDSPGIYVCNACNHSFDPQYISYRIDCWEKGIHRPEFNVLEWRLTWGDHDHPMNYNENLEVFL